MSEAVHEYCSIKKVLFQQNTFLSSLQLFSFIIIILVVVTQSLPHDSAYNMACGLSVVTRPGFFV